MLANPTTVKSKRKAALLMDLAISGAELEHGRKPTGRAPAFALSDVNVAGKLKSRMPTWSPKEDRFLKDSLSWLTDREIGEALGRSEYAVHLRWTRELHLPAPSKAPDVVTAYQAAVMLGIDTHKIAHWVDMEIIPGRRMASKDRKIRLIRRLAFMIWACAPCNWVYFDPMKVTDPKLGRLLKLEAKRWGDEWWTSRQVADYHGVDVNDVKRYIKLRKLPAFHIPVSLGGRNKDRGWSFWRIKKSDAVCVKFIHRGDNQSGFTPRADAWMLKARDELRMPFEVIGRTMKLSGQTVINRYVRLKKKKNKRGRPRNAK